MKGFPFQYLLIGGLFFLLFNACSKDAAENVEIDELNIRIVEEPDRLHPMLSRTGVADQIEQRMYLPLLEVDPQSLELVPAIATGLPEIQTFQDSSLILSYLLQSEASWCDGKKITAEDYLFTMKMIFLPGLDNPWRSYFNLIDSVLINENEPEKVSFKLAEPYILAVPATASLQAYPKHKIDPNRTLDEFTLSQLQAMDSLPESLQPLMDYFRSDSLSRYQICNSGPYTLKSWEANQYLVLEKEEGHWTTIKQKDLSGLKAIPKRLNYLIIPEEANAIAQIRNGNIDILSGLSPTQFKSLKADSAFAERHRFYTPSTFKQYIILLNNEHPILGEIAVRKALSALTDRAAFIEDALAGLGMPSTSPVHPNKAVYDTSARQVSFDPRKAVQLLEENGWLDLDEDGIREKMINGQKTPLQLTFLSTGSSLGNAIGLRLKENALKAGMDVLLEQMPFKNILTKMRAGEFDMSPLSISTSPFPDDPYQTWHTDNIGAGRSNLTRFGNDSTDAIIEALRVEMDVDLQGRLYRQFQLDIAQWVPAIFLAAPQECIISKDEFQLVTGPVKPGFAPQLTQHNQDGAE